MDFMWKTTLVSFRERRIPVLIPWVGARNGSNHQLAIFSRHRLSVQTPFPLLEQLWWEVGWPSPGHVVVQVSVLALLMTFWVIHSPQVPWLSTSTTAHSSSFQEKTHLDLCSFTPCSSNQITNFAAQRDWAPSPPTQSSVAPLLGTRENKAKVCSTHTAGWWEVQHFVSPADPCSTHLQATSLLQDALCLGTVTFSSHSSSIPYSSFYFSLFGIWIAMKVVLIHLKSSFHLKWF